MESYTIPTRIGRKTITADKIADGVVPSTDPKDNGGTGSASSTTAPTEFAIISSATYSAKNITGSADWVEVTTAADHGYSKGDKVTIYGLNNNLVNATGTFPVSEVVSTTVFRYSPALNGFYSSVVTLTTEFIVTNRSRTVTTATLKLSTAAHGLTAGAVITITDVPDQADYNGTFFVDTVSGDTITYKFESELATSEATTTSTGTVHAVTHKYAIIGDTWIDTSVTPNTYKVWNGLKWTDSSNIPDGVIIDDHLAPAAPTGLSATQNGYYDSSSGGAKIAVNLKWTAPTTNSDGSTLRDLAGYKVFYKYTAGVDSTGDAGSGGYDTTTTNTDGTLTGVFTYGANIYQSPTTVSFSTDVGTVQPTSVNVDGKTSGSIAWTISGLSESQQATLSWTTTQNGYGDITGTAGSTTAVSKNNHGASSFYYDIYGDTSIKSSTQPTAATPSGGTGGASTAATDWQDGPDISADKTEAVISGLNTASEIQFAVQAYDSSKKNYSAYSDALTVATGKPAIVVNAPSKPIVEVRLGTATITWDGNDSSGNVPPSSLNYLEVHIGSTSGFIPSDSTYKGSIAFVGAGSGNFVVVDGLAYNSTWYAKFIAVSTTGSKTSPSIASDQFTIVPLVDTDLIANTLTNWPFIGGVVNAAALANGAVSARTLAQNAITSSNIANVITPGAISTGLIAANAIGADQIAAGAIVAGKIGADAVTANTISAGSIVAGKLAVNSIVASNISAGAITAEKLTADAIDGKVITGATVRTAASGARVQLDSTGLYAYNSSGSPTFSIAASTGTVIVGGYATQAAVDSKASTSYVDSGLSNKISTGGAATDVNNYTTTISGGKITTGTIDASKILVTDTFLYRNSAGTYSVSIGNNAVDGRDNNPGVSFNDSSGTSLGWIGYWNTGPALEVGTSFLGNYIDMYSSTNSVRWNSSGNITINSDSILDISGYNNLNLSSANGAVFAIGQFRNQYAYDNATTTVPNLTISTAGLLRRTTHSNSSRDIKTDIAPLEFNLEGYLSLIPVTYKYKAEVESGKPNPTTFSGFIAEDLDDAGFKELVQYNKHGKPEAIRYDRLAAYLHLIVKDQERRLSDLERKLQ